MFTILILKPLLYCGKLFYICYSTKYFRSGSEEFERSVSESILALEVSMKNIIILCIMFCLVLSGCGNSVKVKFPST